MKKKKEKNKQIEKVKPQLVLSIGLVRHAVYDEFIPDVPKYVYIISYSYNTVLDCDV